MTDGFCVFLIFILTEPTVWNRLTILDPYRRKINFCEDAYHRWGTPSIFKITPLLPDDFEKRLIDRRYAVQHVTEVMTPIWLLADYHATCQCAAGTYHQ